MKAKLLVGLFALICAVATFFGSREAQATVTLQAVDLGFVAPGFETWALWLVSDDEPIMGFDYLSANAWVHQAGVPGALETPLLDMVNYLPTEMRPYDSHLLFHSSEIIPSGTITEDNDGSNPLGMPSVGSYAYGIGPLFAEPFGLVMPSTMVDFMYLAVPYGAPCTVVGSAFDMYHVSYGFEWSINTTPQRWIATNPGELYFNNTRVGTTSQSSVSAWIDGDSGEDVYGWYSASPPFGPDGTFCWLSNNDSTNINFTFSPTSRGSYNGMGDIHADGVDSAHVTLSGTGVGPVFGAEQPSGTTIDFGDFAVDSFFDVFFDLSNVTSDPELGDLTKLTIEAEIQGGTPSAFEIVGFEGNLFELLVGETDEIQLRFNTSGLAPGEYSGVLVCHADVGAAVGDTAGGQAYSFALMGTVLMPGDTNGDHKVDYVDAGIVADFWRKSATGPAQGDFNGDGFVDETDASILAANWCPGGHEQTSPVPEPSILAGLLALGLVCLKRRMR